MATNDGIRVGPIRKFEVEEAARIVRLAFGTFLGLPNPLDFMDDRDMIRPRWRSSHVKVIAARDTGRLIGSNAVTRWGSFGFFGPLTVLPEYWDRGVAQKLLETTMDVFKKWGVRQMGLATFPHSAKHIGLYQKFGFWPQYLTAVMTKTPEEQPARQNADKDGPMMLSSLPRNRRDEAIRMCGRLTNKILRGLDLGDEIRSALKQRVGDVVLIFTRGVLDGFALCMHGPGSEGGEKLCFIKFAAARPGNGVGERFSRLLGAIDQFAYSRGVPIEAGVNLAHQDAFRLMRSHRYRTAIQLVALQHPHTEGFNRGDVYVMDDWR